MKPNSKPNASPEQRKQARALYVQERLPMTEIANRLKVSTRTIQVWKTKAAEAGDDWAKVRAALLSMQGVEDLSPQILESAYNLTQSVLMRLKENPNMDPLVMVDAIARISDAYAKIARGMERFDPKTTELAVASKVLELQKMFIRSRYPQHLATFAEILEPFGIELSKTFGK